MEIRKIHLTIIFYQALEVHKIQRHAQRMFWSVLYGAMGRTKRKVSPKLSL